MDIIIYESSSFGGCYDYSLQLLGAYKKHAEANSVRLILPRNSKFEGDGCRKFLLKDKIDISSKLLRKAWFIGRVFINPLLLFFYLLGRRRKYVLLNDFEQLSAWLWAPLYRFLLPQHKFAVFLHDPNRDAYPPSTQISSFLMKCMMRTMHLAFYHEILPQKEYYKGKKTKYEAVPHGIYPAPSADRELLEKLDEEIQTRYTFALIGNIRHEKNTDLVIKALAKVPAAHLIVAGSPASSAVNVEDYRKLAEELGVGERISWVLRFLSEAEMSSVIERADCVLLYYKSTFVSQSAILNLIAPFQKKLIVSNTQSALAQTVRKYDNGMIVEPDSQEALSKAMIDILTSSSENKQSWQAYLNYASWSKNAEIVVDAFAQV